MGGPQTVVTARHPVTAGHSVTAADRHLRQGVGDDLRRRPPAGPGQVGVDDGAPRVGQRRRHGHLVTEPPEHAEQGVLHQVLGRLPVSGEQVGEPGQRDRLLGREPGQRLRPVAQHTLPPARCGYQHAHTSTDAASGTIRCMRLRTSNGACSHRLHTGLSRFCPPGVML
jgi:hypothetical protein